LVCRLGRKASLACEALYFTPEDEALFEQMDRKRISPDEAAQRIREFIGRQKALTATT
jgi:hypothetical protein